MRLLILVFIVLLSSCVKKNNLNTNKQVSILYGGDIITMAGEKIDYVEALAHSDGKILYVGNKVEVQEKYKNAKMIDLKGGTLMPGFIEPHLHGSLAAVFLQNEIIAPYDWVIPSGVKKGVVGHKAYIKRITDSIKANAKKDKIYFIWGYHQLWHGDMSRQILNNITKEYPVAILHRSFHEIFLNDAAIKKLGIKEEDYKANPQVEWGRGHFYEGGWLALVPKMAPYLLEPNSYLAGLSNLSKLLLLNGVTTAADPGFPNSNFEQELSLLMKEMSKNPPYDFYLIPNGTQLYSMKGGNKNTLKFIETLSTNPEYNSTNLKFLPKQVKLFADGAIYSQLMQMKENYTDGHKGEWMTPLDLLKEQIEMYWKNSYKIHMHSNGDLGQQQVIDYVRIAKKKYPRNNHRFTLHHMGYFDEKIANDMSELNMEASVNPYYLWALADKYTDYGLGKKRGHNLVAMKLLIDRKIPLSFHSDFSMSPVEPLTLAWTAVNRVTSEGSSVSQDQKISVFDAMKAITITAARTLDLENEIGSIEVGKRANFTLLKENPFKVKPIKIKDIKVEGVIYNSVTYLNE
ncbi:MULTISPECIES: amidohydrolase [unclassified Halobacteriovorax]|uniref:amidohydrolase n=1 Tax=unclassified Halobacteriovorax TaxID=2639665 RepID=UPI003999AD51